MSHYILLAAIALLIIFFHGLMVNILTACFNEELLFIASIILVLVLA